MMDMKRFDGVKLVVTDLDGTLLSSDKTIARGNLEAASRLRAAGIHVTVASGRPHQMIQAYVRQLGVDVPVICSNGAILYDCAAERTVEAVKLRRDASLKILGAARRIEADYLAYTEKRVWFTESSRRVGRIEEFNRIAKMAGDSTMDISFFAGSHVAAMDEGILKILVVERGGDDVGLMRAAAENVDGILLETPENGALEINDAGAGKGNGVRRLCKHLGIAPHEVCVFGDWYNDMSMFEAAGYSVAMDNALYELKRIATVITDSNDMGGFARAVGQYIL